MNPHLKHLLEDTKAVNEVLGIVIMISIVILVATVLHISIQQTTDSELHQVPMVSMVQSSDQVIIVGVQFGKVDTDETIIQVLDDSGSTTGIATLHNASANLASGDKITFSGLQQKKSYTIQVIYFNHLIGIIDYLSP